MLVYFLWPSTKCFTASTDWRFFLLLDTRFIERIESHKLDMNDDTVVLVINEKIYKQKSYLLTFLEKPPRTS